jgi:hypothetical protein
VLAPAHERELPPLEVHRRPVPGVGLMERGPAHLIRRYGPPCYRTFRFHPYPAFRERPTSVDSCSWIADGKLGRKATWGEPSEECTLTDPKFKQLKQVTPTQATKALGSCPTKNTARRQTAGATSSGVGYPTLYGYNRCSYVYKRSRPPKGPARSLLFG